MDPLASRAIAGYANSPAPAARAGIAKPTATGGQDFASFFQAVAKQSVAALEASESAGLQGMQGSLDAQSVVEAVAQAELVVQTVTAVRDRVVEAYQELARMPI